MSTPTCHRTIGPSFDHDKGQLIAMSGDSCIGSRCALWVPEIDASGYVGPRVPGSADRRVTSEDDKGFTSGKPSGKGWCAENLRRAPWADPHHEIARRVQP